MVARLFCGEFLNDSLGLYMWLRTGWQAWMDSVLLVRRMCSLGLGGCERVCLQGACCLWLW